MLSLTQSLHSCKDLCWTHLRYTLDCYNTTRHTANPFPYTVSWNTLYCSTLRICGQLLLSCCSLFFLCDTLLLQGTIHPVHSFLFLLLLDSGPKISSIGRCNTSVVVCLWEKLKKKKLVTMTITFANHNRHRK